MTEQEENNEAAGASQENFVDEEPSIRYERLQQISQRSLTESVKYLTTERLESCYPSIAKAPKGKQALQKARDQIANYWESSATKEFNAVFEERDVAEKMKQLDNLIDEAEQRKENKIDESPVYLDSLTPQRTVDSHLYPIKQQSVDKLEKELAELRAENEELLKQVNGDSESISNLAASIEEVFKDLDLSIQSTSLLPSRSELAKFTSSIASTQSLLEE